MSTDEQRWTVDLDAVDGAAAPAEVGGKGAQLAALRRLDGVRVPEGICVTTRAYRRWRADGGGAVPAEVAAAIERALAALGDTAPVAVRSSATAEDAGDASFAGQHASSLGVVGAGAVIEHVLRVWRSLLDPAAVAYRVRAGVAEDEVAMAVVVQRMVDARAAGVLFTADPVTSDRRVVAIEAVPGLGDALVAGRVAPQRLEVRSEEVVRRGPAGDATLSDEQAVQLASLGRRIERELGGPQDVEWCLDEAGFAVVQSRPITTLFPVPEADGHGLAVWLSVGHQQMMTDALKPLGLSLFQLTAAARMREAGSRLFVDAAPMLTAPGRGEALVAMIGRGDPLTGDALRTLLERGDVRTTEAEATPAGAGVAPPDTDVDPNVIEELVAEGDASLARLERDLRGRTGADLAAFVLADLEELKRVVFDPRSMRVITVAMEAAWWLDDHLEAWLGEPGLADVLNRSVPGDVTAQMGLALLDVADAVRPHPEVVALLEAAEDDGFLDALEHVEGGPAARRAIQGYLDAYGMRCAGEIDVTRPRWRERPSTLLPALLADVRAFASGEGRRRFEAGRREAEAAADELLRRVAALPDGVARAAQARTMIDRVRTLSGYREHPKFHIVCRYRHYRRALLAEAARLTDAGVLDAPEDVAWLTLPELAEVARTQRVDRELLRARKRAFARHAALTPPRVMTSHGEVVTGSYRRDDLPAGALVGLAVSSGTVEGRARVVHDLADAHLEPGDVLVTTHTDPSWSPLFVAAAGLVAEVGGRMTHGAVIAREYGLPAVVGVEEATARIPDGARVRVHGSGGWVELLD